MEMPELTYSEAGADPELDLEGGLNPGLDFGGHYCFFICKVS